MCVVKSRVLTLCQQIAELEYELEQEVGDMTDTSVIYSRNRLVSRGDTRALAVFDSFDRVKAAVGVQNNKDEDILQLCRKMQLT